MRRSAEPGAVSLDAGENKADSPGAVVPVMAVREFPYQQRPIGGVVAWGAVLAVGVVWPSRASAQADAPESPAETRHETPDSPAEVQYEAPESPTITEHESSELAKEAARLTYDAPAECPAEAVFFRQVDARVDRAWQAAPEALARQVEVVVEHDDAGFVAYLRFTDALGNAVSRMVEGEDCDEVVEGIAIVTGLAIESLLAPRPRVGESRELATEPDAPPPEPTEPPAPPLTLPPAPLPPARWHHELALDAGLLWGLGPAPAPMLGVRWAVGPEHRSDLLALRVVGADTTQVTAHGVQLRFQLLAARIETCPVAATVGDRLSFPLCAGGEVGFVAARGYENPPRIVDGKSDVVPWIAATIGPGLRLASRSVFVQLKPTLLILIPSWTYRVQKPEADVFSTPRVAGSISASGGVRFP